MTFAAALLLLLVAALLSYDVAVLRGKNRRALWVEAAAFLVGGFFIAFPDRATALAHLVGIGRGVDFLLYPIVIWLVRESLSARRRRVEDAERLTQVTRALALLEARRFEAAGHGPTTSPAAQSAACSTSRTV
ncbi:MAG TPA: DUF2304 domain-containing protein [Minicystis sp.]|nr:DUF2304 domain-containing protein [Minicystis sp.]